MKNLRTILCVCLLCTFFLCKEQFMYADNALRKEILIQSNKNKKTNILERSYPSQNVYATLFTESNIIEIQGEHLEDVQISIVDDFGSIMMETNQNISHKSVIKLNDNLPSGKYYLIIESEYYHGEGVFYLN